jgi:hypothetical protein
VTRALRRRLGRLETAMLPIVGGDAGPALEHLRRRLEATATCMRAARGSGPLTPKEKSDASLAELLAWAPDISRTATDRIRAHLAGQHGS